MDRDPNANQLDPIERETPSTGENDTGDSGDASARIMEERRTKGIAPENVHSPVQTKQTPSP